MGCDLSQAKNELQEISETSSVQISEDAVVARAHSQQESLTETDLEEEATRNLGLLKVTLLLIFLSVCLHGPFWPLMRGHVLLLALVCTEISTFEDVRIVARYLLRPESARLLFQNDQGVAEDDSFQAGPFFWCLWGDDPNSQELKWKSW